MEENFLSEDEEEIINGILPLLSDLTGHAYELKSDKGIAFAVMLDSALRYGTQIFLGNDPRLTEEFCHELKEAQKNGD